ncbi:MAG: SRPBCC domain-containing protein, partial [Acetobacteraceae bacterium]
MNDRKETVTNAKQPLSLCHLHPHDSGKTVHALRDPEFNRKYWGGAHQESDWKPGSAWKLILPDGRLADEGEVLEIDPPRLLVLRWRHQLMPELKTEGETRCRFEIEATGIP